MSNNTNPSEIDIQNETQIIKFLFLKYRCIFLVVFLLIALMEFVYILTGTIMYDQEKNDIMDKLLKVSREKIDRGAKLHFLHMVLHSVYLLQLVVTYQTFTVFTISGFIWYRM